MTTTTAAGDVPRVSRESAGEVTEGDRPSATDGAAGAGAGRLPMTARLTRALELRGDGLTGPGCVLLAVLVMVPGAAVDRALGGSFGAASTVTFVVASVASAGAVRLRAAATAAVLPPLLFAGTATLLAWSSGANSGLREVALDVGTTLALSAPTLFLGTAAAIGVVLVRLVLHRTQR